jgi:hypothetical protein
MPRTYNAVSTMFMVPDDPTGPLRIQKSDGSAMTIDSMEDVLNMVAGYVLEIQMAEMKSGGGWQDVLLGRPKKGKR